MAKEPEEDTPSGPDNIRRVYALPAEMVERITKFQKDKGLTSEVEAVRRLLDEALKTRDNLETLINRILAKLGQTKIASEAARDVLVGHPLVASISFGDDYVQFSLKNEMTARVFENGKVEIVSRGYGEADWEFWDDKNRYKGGGFDIGVPF
ncbi:hypothetical protein RGQ15_14105 [Paracoccus sp. MBLB3053]|uniref:Uncharacterized protein n=1 Tax=Paracoccus aurantius TaxID=3073814 RepID=A0ABU2HVW3_9RHOB|nr:hypothetical protein [Paracoccus sp. MBLB3053]MDS9468695.1 hypothetical protein [Paracoccus sp. MBLB3053]